MKHLTAKGRREPEAAGQRLNVMMISRLAAAGMLFLSACGSDDRSGNEAVAGGRMVKACEGTSVVYDREYSAPTTRTALEDHVNGSDELPPDGYVESGRETDPERVFFVHPGLDNPDFVLAVTRPDDAPGWGVESYTKCDGS